MTLAAVPALIAGLLSSTRSSMLCNGSLPFVCAARTALRACVVFHCACCCAFSAIARIASDVSNPAKFGELEAAVGLLLVQQPVRRGRRRRLRRRIRESGVAARAHRDRARDDAEHGAESFRVLPHVHTSVNGSGARAMTDCEWCARMTSPPWAPLLEGSCSAAAAALPDTPTGVGGQRRASWLAVPESTAHSCGSAPDSHRLPPIPDRNSVSRVA